MRSTYLISVALSLSRIVGAHESIEAGQVCYGAWQQAVHQLSREGRSALLEYLQLAIKGLDHKHVSTPCIAERSADHIVSCKVLTLHS